MNLFAESFAVSAQKILERKLVFVSGKGGIGKTTFACVLAQLAQSQGKKVLIVENAPFSQVIPLFLRDASNPPIHTEIQLDRSIWSLNLTADGNFKDFLHNQIAKSQIRKSALVDSVFNNKLVRSFLDAIPGLNEILLLGRLFYICKLSGSDYDLVIFDSYASGHFLSLMTTPEAVLRTGLPGPITTETTRLVEFLKDKSLCGTVYVGKPESLIVSEMLDFIPLLQHNSPTKLVSVILNEWMTFDELYLSEKSQRQNLQQNTLLAKLNSELKGIYNEPIIKIPHLGFFAGTLPDFFVIRGRL